MRIAATVARYLLGIMFTVFGLNGFLQFIHQPLPTHPLALQFFVATSASLWVLAFPQYRRSFDGILSAKHAGQG